MQDVGDRMTSTESIMWTVEKDPSLRSDFVNVTILDRPPDSDRLMGKVERAMQELPRLRQRVVTPPLRLAPPEWIHDPEFDLGYHLRRVAVPAPGGLRQLLDYAAVAAATPFDRARPLWEFTVVEGLEGGRAALLQKVHHTITDGVGGVKLSMALLDLERDPAAPPSGAPASGRTGGPGRTDGGADDGADDDADSDAHGEARTTPLGVLTGALLEAARQQLHTARRVLETTAETLRHPGEAPQVIAGAMETARSARQQLLVAGGALSPLTTARSLGRRFEVSAVPLGRAKTVAKTLGGTVNDLFVTGVAGAMGLYHDRMGMPVEALRLAMPVSLRKEHDGVGGNRFIPARMVVPVGPKDPRRRFEAVQSALSGVRAESAFGMAEGLASLVGMLPTSVLVPLTRAQTRTVDFAASNVRGAPFDLFLAGSHIEANYPMGPCTGCAVNVTTLSYLDSLDLGVNLDPAAVTDHGAFMECLAESFEGLLDLGP